MLKGSGAAVTPQQDSACLLRWASAIAVGLPCIVLATGVVYSLSGIRGGNYGENVILAMAHGFLMWLVFRLGRCERMPAAAVWLALAIGCVGPVVIGHLLGYRDLQAYAYGLVQEDVSGRYPAPWKSLSQEELFPKWIGTLTGTESDGVWGYLRAQAAIGWEGWEGLKYRTYVVRTGVWSWAAWFWHLILFTVSGTLAFLAAAKYLPAAAASKLATRAGGTTSGDLAVAEQTVDGEGEGPEDLEAGAAWGEHDERQRVKVSYCYEPRDAFPSLHDFFEALVMRRFSHGAQEHVATDVHNYVERVCVMKEITRPELGQFISRYAWSSVGGRAPRVPQNLKSAILCRDEPTTKQAVWETDKGYWEIVWSRE